MSASNPLLIRTNQLTDQFATILASFYHSGIRLPDQDYGLSRDPVFYEKLMRDPDIRLAVEQRQQAVAGIHENVEPGGSREIDRRAAEVIRELIRECKNLQVAKYNLAFAFFCGATYAYLEGERKLLSVGDDPKRGYDAPSLRWWVPTHIKDVNKRILRLTPDDSGGSVVVNREVYSINNREWKPIDDPDRLIKYVYADRDGRFGMGHGLSDACYLYHYMKGLTLSETVAFVERWGQGLVVGEIDSNREGSVGKDNASQAAAWLDKIDKFRSRHAFVHDKDEKITIHDAPTGAQDVNMRFLEYLKAGLVTLILRADRPTGSGTGEGTFAEAKVQQTSSETMYQFDRAQLFDALSAGLVGYLWKANRANLAVMGLSDARMPKLSPHQEIVEDHLKNAQVAQTLLSIEGVTLSRDELYAKTGWTPPLPTDAVVTGRAATVPTIPGIGGAQ